MTMSKVVVKIRTAIGLPKFTVDACRHGGTTELEEAGLTDGQGRALSARRSKAYEGYAKRTEKRAIAATLARQRIGWRTIPQRNFGMNSGIHFGTTAKRNKMALPKHLTSLM